MFLQFFKYILCIDIVLASLTCRCQNLVPNPGFEDYLELPCTINDKSIQNLVVDWFQPLSTTTDYYNANAPEGCELNPLTNSLNAHSGDGMVGIITASYTNGVRTDYQEYIEVKLREKIRKGVSYRLQLYARNSPFHSSLNLKSNNVGMAFSESLILFDISESPSILELPPAVCAAQLIGTEWTKIESCWKADRDYEYLVIGNFKPDATQVEHVLPQQQIEMAYYLIDDIVIEQLSYDVPDLASVAGFCPTSETVELDATSLDAIGYIWDDGSEEPKRIVMSRMDKEYFVTILFSECSYRKSFAVLDFPSLDLGRDTILCNEEQLILKIDYPPRGGILWSDNVTGPVRKMSVGGQYTATIVSDLCLVTDTIEIEFVECPGFIPNVFTPNGDSYNDFFVIDNEAGRNWALKVFDRWGKPIYYSTNYKNEWDGKDASTGVYFYTIEAIKPAKTVRGWVQILR